jgi:hypothetical protein
MRSVLVNDNILDYMPILKIKASTLYVSPTAFKNPRMGKKQKAQKIEN